MAAKDSKEGRKAHLPLWLSPTQVRLIPIKPEFLQFCKNLGDKITDLKIRVDIDDRNESIRKRIREAETEWIRYILVIGEKEVNTKDVNVRDREIGDLKQISFDDFISEIHEQIKNKPFSHLNSNRFVSMRPQIMV